MHHSVILGILAVLCFLGTFVLAFMCFLDEANSDNPYEHAAWAACLVPLGLSVLFGAGWWFGW